jgi:hypothetical protein
MPATTAAATVTPAMRTTAQEIRQRWKAIAPRFKDSAAKLDAALKDGDRATLATLRRSVDVEIQAAAALTTRIDKLLGELRDLQDETDGLAAANPEIERLVAEIGALGMTALAAFRAGKRLMSAADARLSVIEDSADTAERRWAKADIWIRRNLGERLPARQKIAALVLDAERAQAARDTKALDVAKKAAAADLGLRCKLLDLRRDIVKADEVIDTADISADLMKQFAADRREWDELLRDAEADEAQIAMDRDYIAGLAIEQRDARKAAQLIGLPAGEVAKLAKVLEGDEAAMLKGLETLGQQMQPARKGKELFALLRKGKLV